LKVEMRPAKFIRNIGVKSGNFSQSRLPTATAAAVAGGLSGVVRYSNIGAVSAAIRCLPLHEVPALYAAMRSRALACWWPSVVNVCSDFLLQSKERALTKVANIVFQMQRHQLD
jgi:hypothetical protein